MTDIVSGGGKREEGGKAGQAGRELKFMQGRALKLRKAMGTIY